MESYSSQTHHVVDENVAASFFFGSELLGASYGKHHRNPIQLGYETAERFAETAVGESQNSERAIVPRLVSDLASSSSVDHFPGDPLLFVALALVSA